MPKEFYKYIYPSFKPEIIPNIGLKNIALMVSHLYKTSVPVSEKIVFDYDTENKRYLNKYQYEDIMKQFYSTNESVLKNRIEVFKNCDSNNDGSINVIELENLHGYMQEDLLKVNSNHEIYPVDYVVKNFNKKGDGKLNFLDVNMYMNELNINFI